MDDPLAAVDAHVGRNIFENTVAGHFRERGAAVVLVTNGFGYLVDNRVTSIVVLGGGEGRRGEVVERGRYKDLVKANGEFVKIMGEEGKVGVKDVNVEVKEASSEASSRMSDLEVRPSSIVEGAADAPSTPKKLVDVEGRARGDVPISTYMSYLFVGNHTVSFFVRSVVIFLLFFCCECGVSVQDYWLGLWGQVDPDDEDKMASYSNIYFLIFCVLFLLITLRSFLFSVFAVQSSVFSHDNAVANIVRCPTWWFDTTPVGRILNRFAQDLSDVDERLPQVTQFALITCSRVVIVCALACVPVPYMAICMVPVLLGFMRTREYFRRSSREVRLRRGPLRASNGYSYPHVIHFAPLCRLNVCSLRRPRQCSSSLSRRFLGSPSSGRSGGRRASRVPSTGSSPSPRPSHGARRRWTSGCSSG
jgi:hypothetical protein